MIVFIASQDLASQLYANSASLYERLGPKCTISLSDILQWWLWCNGSTGACGAPRPGSIPGSRPTNPYKGLEAQDVRSPAEIPLANVNCGDLL